MMTSTVTARGGGSNLARLIGAAALGACLGGPALGAEPIPLRAGLYCGPGEARIVIDVAHDQVEIDHMVCSFPVIAADHLQSDLCSTPKGESVARNFDFSVVGRDFVHGRNWYRLCGPVPANISAPPSKPGG